MKVKKVRKENSKLLDILKSYYSFYKKNLRRKHIVIYVLSLIVFAFCLITFMNNIDTINQLLSEVRNYKMDTNVFSILIKQKIPVIFLLIFSGITPFIFIPIIGIIGFPYILATSIMNMSVINFVISCIGAIVQIFFVSLAIASGIYYCSQSTKKFRYNNYSTFGLDDVKKQIYESTKKEEKLKKVEEKMAKKSEKLQKLNVKIEYKALIITFVISTLVVCIASIITGV